MSQKIIVNHVMSNDVESKIFSDILGYFQNYGSEQFEYVVSVRPIEKADIFHYHRPNVEESLLTPAVVTVHHDLRENDAWLNYGHFEDRYKEACKIICLNSDQKRFLAGEGIEHSVIIPHGYNPLYLTSNKKKRRMGKIRIGFFSRRYARKVKGEAYLYELCKRLSPEKFEFVMVGQDRTTDARFLRKLGFSVLCYEHLPYPVFCSLYDQIDLLLMVSLFEGGPANIPEAIATSTPVACSRVGMCLDFVKDGKNGLLLDLDPDIDAKRVERLFDVSGELQKLFDGAHDESANAVTWQSVVGLYEKEYLKLVELEGR